MDNLNCKVCQNKQGKVLEIKEMMFGTQEKFNYFECFYCGCIQLIDQLTNIEKYYPLNTYYSYKEQSLNSFKLQLKNFVKTCVAKYYFSKMNIIGYFFRKRLFTLYKWMENLSSIDKKSKILDVGCGNGDVLYRLKKLGFNNLYGIDPFIQNNFVIDNIKIDKKSVFEINEKYDLILLNHSFEHMENQKETLIKLKDILNENGKILIRIPVCDSYCYRKYNINWFQLDAPRHFFTHTVFSLRLLLEQCDLKLKKVTYDSSQFQFYHSEKYQLGYSLQSDYNFNKKTMNYWYHFANFLNEVHDGDQACFLIEKNL